MYFIFRFMNFYLSVVKSQKLTFNTISDFLIKKIPKQSIGIIGPRLKTEGTYKISLVRTSGTAFLKIRSKDFSETWHEVRPP